MNKPNIGKGVIFIGQALSPANVYMIHDENVYAVRIRVYPERKEYPISQWVEKEKLSPVCQVLIEGCPVIQLHPKGWETVEEENDKQNDFCQPG